MFPSAVERIRIDKAAVDEGFGLRHADDGDWLAYEGLGTPGALRLTMAGDNYLVATNHAGVALELQSHGLTGNIEGTPATPVGFAAFAVSGTVALHRLVRDIRRLARSLPQEPLRVYEAKIAHLPRTTEAERLVIMRVGQGVFREALMDYWGGSCAATGVSEPRLLRASHIKPWARCETDAERLDVHNGLLLAAHLDAAFDAGLISFADDGSILLSPRFAPSDRAALGIHEGLTLKRIGHGHLANLQWHRAHLFGNPDAL